MSQRSHSIACDRMRSHAIAWDMGSHEHEIACDCMQSHEIANLMSTTVRVLENASGTRSGTEILPKCFFTTTVNRFHLLFFCLSQKGRNEKRDSFYTAKHVSSVHSCSSERVSSWRNRWIGNGRIIRTASTQCD